MTEEQRKGIEKHEEERRILIKKVMADWDRKQEKKNEEKNTRPRPAHR